MLIILLVLVLSPSCNCQKIQVLIAGHMSLITALRVIFGGEPLVSYQAVPSRLGGVLSYDALMKSIRLYFPRRYEEMRSYDVIILTAPEYNLFTLQQDQWIHDAIEDGAGGINDGSVFSIQPSIHTAWAISIAARAFPNDALAVSNKGGGEAGSLAFRIVINKDYPVPIITPFVPFGVENVKCTAASRLVIPRQAAGTLAYQIGNFPALGMVPYLAVWDYGEGRAMTSGDFMGNGWFGVPGSPASNQYSPDILMNMIFHLTKRDLIDDVIAFHRVKANFMQFRTRMLVLVSLRDFIDRFGANTQVIQDEINRLEDIYRTAETLYMEHDFDGSDGIIQTGLREFTKAEVMAMREKDAALLWIYVIEWLIASSTLIISGMVLWTLMVRRRLYRSVQVTRQLI